MAKIFISYSSKDVELVKHYVDALKSNGHEIVMDDTVLHAGDDFRKTLMDSLRDADGTIVFLTENGIKSVHVTSEIGLARSYFDNEADKRFLIPLVTSGVEVPYTIQDLFRFRLEINYHTISETVKKINNAIVDFQQKYKTPIEPSSSQQLSDIPVNEPKKEVRQSRKDIRQTQTALKKLGLFSSVADGIYGRETAYAIKSFQAGNNLPNTGELDETTYNLITATAAGYDGEDISNIHSSSAGAAPQVVKGFDKVTALTSLAQNFINDFTTLIKENDDWYEFTLDDEDRNFGAKITTALAFVESSIKTASSLDYSTVELRDDVRAIIKRASENVASVIQEVETAGNGLFSHYEIKSPKEEYAHDVVVLTKFVAVATWYKNAFIQLTPLFLNDDPIPESLQPLITAKTALKSLPVITDDANPNNPSPPPEPSPVTPQTIDTDIITSILSDVPDAETVDNLDIMPDVNALASVIAYKDLTPPLAIGLFGNWGSGKSFFMKKLRKQIDVFATDDGDEYVERVVHIEFNSWHYSDSNLWASFVTKIFEDIDSYGKNHQNAVQNLFKRLNESSEFLTEANTKLEGVKATIITLENELNTKKNEIAKKSENLNGIKLTDIAKQVFNNADVKEKLKEVKKQLPQKEINNIGDVYRSAQELSGFFNKFVETVKLLLSFKSWKSWVALILFVIICTSPFWLFAFFNVEINKVFSWFGKYSAPVAIVFTNLAGIAAYASVGLNKIQEKLKSIASECAVLEKQSLKIYQIEVDKIQSELDIAKQGQIQKEAEINKLKKDQAEIQASIDDIQSGKKLASFIAGRVTDQRYSNNLGLISWIRKDFQQLHNLLKEQRELNNFKNKTPEEKQQIFQVDRIVLYIDDLDRCNEDVVVKVLEAIHLLLAFELFVVIVGVDPRWMHNALENKYSGQLKKIYNQQLDNKTETRQNLDAATSYDYLEKIFQVPFCLREINKPGRFSLIEENLKKKEKPAQKKQEEERKADEGRNENKGGDTATTAQASGGDTKPVNGNTAPTQEKPEKITSEQEQTARLELEKKKNTAVVKSAKAQLEISAEEIAFMKQMSELIGNSPRTVNRFINIYRIIRSHKNLNKSANPLECYCATMVLLGIITGLPNQSESFFKAMLEGTQITFGDLVSEMGDEYQLLKDATAIPLNASSPETVGNMAMDLIKKKFELVQRFSFRSYE